MLGLEGITGSKADLVLLLRAGGQGRNKSNNHNNKCEIVLVREGALRTFTQLVREGFLEGDLKDEEAAGGKCWGKGMCENEPG